MIKRDKYLTQLISAKNNGFPKVITGVRRCGKSFLLKEIYREYLLSDNVPENRIIILELDDDKNSNYRDPLELGAYIREKCKDKENYYVFIDEIQKVYSIINPRIAKILVFTKRMKYRAIFHNDDYSFNELQVVKVANEFKDTLGKLVSKAFKTFKEWWDKTKKPEIAEKAKTSILQKLRESQAIVDQRKEQQVPNLNRNNLRPER